MYRSSSLIKIQSPKKGKRFARRGRRGGDNNVTEGDVGRHSKGPGYVAGGFRSVSLQSLCAPDTVVVRMRYETTSAFTSTGGAASFVQVVGNTIYHPYTGNTDNCGGYARMYAQYAISEVLSCKLTVRLWGGVAGQDEPFRIVVIPCEVNQYTVYAAYTNIAQLYDVPHAKQVLFSPGGVLPTITSSATTAQILFGQSRETGAEFAAGSTSAYAAATGAQPSNLWYFLIGYQNMAGTTTTNQQAQVSMEYEVRFIRPIALAVQVSVNKHGNEEDKPATSSSTERKTLEAKTEAKTMVGLSPGVQAAAAPTFATTGAVGVKPVGCAGEDGRWVFVSGRPGSEETKSQKG